MPKQNIYSCISKNSKCNLCPQLFTSAFYLKKHNQVYHHGKISQLDGEDDSESNGEVEIEQAKKDSAADYFESEDELIEEMRKETRSVEA